MIRYVALGMFSIFFYGEKKVGICSFFHGKKNLCYYVNNYALVNIMLQIISSVFERQFTTYYNISTQLLLYELPNPYLVADDAGDISRDIRRNVKMHLLENARQSLWPHILKNMRIFLPAVVSVLFFDITH